MSKRIVKNIKKIAHVHVKKDVTNQRDDKAQYEIERGSPNAADVELYQNGADEGHASDQFTLGVCYGDGIGVDKDEQKAVELYQKAADQGYASAQFNLGVCYGNGIGVERDEQKAVELYQKA